MPRDLSDLVYDIEEATILARSKAAVRIHTSLQHEGPWWTGSFQERWKIDTKPIAPTEERVEGEGGLGRLPPAKHVMVFGALKQALYVGNAVEYAGFVINEPAATMPGRDGDPVTYAQHAAEVREKGGDITPPSKDPDWFTIYLSHGRARFLINDLNKGFKRAGFKIVKSTRA